MSRRAVDIKNWAPGNLKSTCEAEAVRLAEAEAEAEAEGYKDLVVCHTRLRLLPSGLARALPRLLALRSAACVRMLTRRVPTAG